MRASITKSENISGLELARLRVESGLTQEQLAGRLGVSRNYIYLLESGKKPMTAKVVTKVRAELLTGGGRTRFAAEPRYAPAVVREGRGAYGQSCTESSDTPAPTFESEASKILEHFGIEELERAHAACVAARDWNAATVIARTLATKDPARGKKLMDKAADGTRGQPPEQDENPKPEGST